MEIPDIPAIDDNLKNCINVKSFFDEEGRGRYALNATKKSY